MMTPNELAHLLNDYTEAVEDFLHAMAHDDEDDIGKTSIDLARRHAIVRKTLAKIFSEPETEH